MNSAYTIRPFQKSDGEALRTLHIAAILAIEHDAYSDADLNSWATGLTAEGYARAAENSERFEVATDKTGLAVGFCSTANDHVTGLYVHPDHQGNGIASELLGRAETCLRERGIAVSVMDSSVSAAPFYMRHGYTLLQYNRRKTRGGTMIRTADLEKNLI